MAHWLDSIGSWMVSSYAGEFVALFGGFLLAAVAVALINECHKRLKRTRYDASVAALEALYALPDMRDCQRR